MNIEVSEDVIKEVVIRHIQHKLNFMDAFDDDTFTDEIYSMMKDMLKELLPELKDEIRASLKTSILESLDGITSDLLRGIE